MLLISGITFLSRVPASEAPPSEYALKAALIYRFVDFVTWPEDAFQSREEPLIVTVLGPDPFGSALEEIMQQGTVQGRRVVVQRIRDEQHLTSCHVLFVSSSEASRRGEILHNVQGRPILTVGDSGGFCEAGGIVNLVRKERHVRFQINPGAARRAGLKISSQLLKLATIVRDTEEEGS